MHSWGQTPSLSPFTSYFLAATVLWTRKENDKSCFLVFVDTEVFLAEGTDLSHCVYKSVITQRAFILNPRFFLLLWQTRGLEESKMKSDLEIVLIVTNELNQEASKMLVGARMNRESIWLGLFPSAVINSVTKSSSSRRSSFHLTPDTHSTKKSVQGFKARTQREELKCTPQRSVASWLSLCLAQFSLSYSPAPPAQGWYYPHWAGASHINH